MKKHYDDDTEEYLTFSEIKEEFPKAARIWNWTAKMFYYLHEGGFVRRRMNQSIKAPEYCKSHIIRLIGIINDNLDDMRI